MATAAADDDISTALLNRAHSPDTASTIFRERVKQRPLVLRPTSPDPKVNARAKRQHERLKKERAVRKSNKPKPLSAKQKRALRVFDIPKEQRKYHIYAPLYEMWCTYIRDVLGLADGRRQNVDMLSAGPVLAAADYHGAEVEVTKSRCVSRVGLRE